MTKKKVELPLHKTCQKCKKSKTSTRQREMRTELYQGPCGDSFCYHSCDMETCHPIHAAVCDECAAKITGKEKKK
jgi:hypothetical protein